MYGNQVATNFIKLHFSNERKLKAIRSLSIATSFHTVAGNLYKVLDSFFIQSSETLHPGHEKREAL